MKSTVVAIGMLAFALAAPASAKEVLHVVERVANMEAITDIGAKGDSAADLLTFSNPVYDNANETQLGTDQGYCVRVVVGKSWECWWTLFLAEGQITVQGPFRDIGDSVLAITGGTGKYSGVRGQMKLHPRNEEHSEYDFIYELE